MTGKVVSTRDAQEQRDLTFMIPSKRRQGEGGGEEKVLDKEEKRREREREGEEEGSPRKEPELLPPPEREKGN